MFTIDEEKSEIYDKYFNIISPLYNPNMDEDEFLARIDELEEFLGMKLKLSTVSRFRVIGQ